MKKYILLSLFLLINYLSAHAELDKITIAKSFLTAWKPTVILIHNYEGNINQECFNGCTLFGKINRYRLNNAHHLSSLPSHQQPYEWFH